MDNLARLFGQLNPFSLFTVCFKMFADEGEGGGEGEGEGEGEEGKTGHFSEGFSEETRNHPSVKKFKSTEDMAKSYVNLETKIGAKGVIVPGENSSKEEIQAYHEALGNYTDPEKVEILPLPEGTDERITLAEDDGKMFKDLAVKFNLNKFQSDGLQQWWLDKNIAALKDIDANLKDGSEKAMVELTKEWGAKTEENLAKAKQVAKLSGGDELLKWMEKGEGNNPIVIKALANIASKLSEDTLGKGGDGSLTMTPGQAKIEIAKIRDNPHSAYNDGNHRDHKEAVEHFKSLYAMAYPDKKA